MKEKYWKIPTSFQNLEDLHEMIADSHTDVVAKWEEEIIILYSDKAGTNITTPDDEFHHFETWEEFIKEKLFNGKSFEEVFTKIVILG